MQLLHKLEDLVLLCGPTYLAIGVFDGLQLGHQTVISHEFAKTRPEDFVAKLYRSANDLREICVGDGWRFGSDRSGDMSLLKLVVEGFGIRLTTAS